MRYDEGDSTRHFQKMGKGRPGGNPNLERFQFEPEYDYGSETCSEFLALRVPPSLKAKLKAGALDDWQELVRQTLLHAIAQGLEERIAQTEKPPATPGATELEQGELARTGEEEPARTTGKRGKTPTGRRTQTAGKKQQRRNAKPDGES